MAARFSRRARGTRSSPREPGVRLQIIARERGALGAVEAAAARDVALHGERARGGTRREQHQQEHAHALAYYF